jgi:hypothetical protein
MLVRQLVQVGNTVKLRETPKDLDTKRPLETVAWPS